MLSTDELYAKKYEDANGKCINDFSGNDVDRLSKTIFTFDNIETIISRTGEKDSKIYASAIIDILIDKGVIVPSIAHNANEIVRVYKMGEYSKLTAEQLRLFAFMLHSYQNNVNRSLYKTEFEKLCVLFFSFAIKQNHFYEQTEYEEDCYGICYSLYGPRVSNSNKRYRVPKDSTLITDFIDKDIVRRINEENHVKYYLPRPCTIENYQLSRFCMGFAFDFSQMESVFKQNPYTRGSNPWNDYVHTYLQYLTLAAIGENHKNHILALCAEVYQITKLNDSMFFSYSQSIEKKEFEIILSGINSGLWKYLCFKNNALRLTNEQILKKNMNAYHVISWYDYTKDDNPKLGTIIDRLGSLLYRTAFFINEFVLFLNNNARFKVDENEDSEIDDSEIEAIETRTIFNQTSYNACFGEERNAIEKDFAQYAESSEDRNKVLEKIKEYMAEASFLMDLCDLYLKTNNPNYMSRRKLFVVYSNANELPSSIEGINELSFPSISAEKVCKIYGLPDDYMDNRFVSNALRKTYHIRSIQYYVFDMKEEWEGAIQIANEARGASLVKVIMNVINKKNENPESEMKPLVVVSFHDNLNQEYRKDGYIYTLHSKIELTTGYFEYTYYVGMEDNMKKQEINIYNPGSITNSPIGTTGNISYSESINDVETIQKMINNMIDVVNRQVMEDKEEVLSHIEELQNEIVKEQPNKSKIYGIIDWLEKITSIAGFALSLKGLFPS